MVCFCSIDRMKTVYFYFIYKTKIVSFCSVNRIKNSVFLFHIQNKNIILLFYQ